jgi:hypothetical protein
MIRRHVREPREAFRTLGLCRRAPSPERAAARRIRWARQVTGEDHPPSRALTRGIGDGNRREQRTGVTTSSSALPLAVSNAGGLRVVAAGPMRLPDLQRTLDEMAADTARPWAVNLPLHRAEADDVIELLLARRPPVLIASQGGPRRYLDRFHEIGTRCLHVVAGTEHACKAAPPGSTQWSWSAPKPAATRRPP